MFLLWIFLIIWFPFALTLHIIMRTNHILSHLTTMSSYFLFHLYRCPISIYLNGLYQ